MLTDCPFFPPTPLLNDLARAGQFPRATQEPFPLTTIRHKLARIGGKLVLHGSPSWQSQDVQAVGPVLHELFLDAVPVDALETVSWKATVVRTAGSYSQ
jgi:hypothetical protein